MKHRRLGVLLSACLLLSCNVSGDPRPDTLLLVANQMEHSVLLVDPMSKQVLATVGVDINGHEVAVSPDGRFGYVPIYGNTWVGKPGSNGSTIHVVDLRQGRTVAVIDLGKEVRPHSAHFGPDGLLYVSAELANAIYIVDTNTRSLVGEIPTGASHTHMFVFSPDGQRIYTANNEAGSVSVLDVRARTLLATIPISKRVQRISISPDGKFVFTQDQETPRIVVIDTATKAVVRSISLPRIVVLFRDHKRRSLAPCQLRIRKALRRRCRQWSTYQNVRHPGCSRSTHPRRIRTCAGRHIRLCELSPGRHHRDPES